MGRYQNGDCDRIKFMDDNRRFRNTEILTQNDKYILKKEREEDKQVYFDLYKEDFILAKRMSSDMFQDFFEKQWENRKQENSLYVSVFRRLDSVYLGNIVLRDLESRTPELGIDVMKKHQRKGMAYDTLRMFMKWASETYSDIEYFFVRICSDNLASLNLFQKLGAIKIGEEPSEYQAFLNQFKERVGKEEYEKVKKKNPDMEDIAERRYIAQYKLEYKKGREFRFQN